jgi:hypothetical protein
MSFARQSRFEPSERGVAEIEQITSAMVGVARALT